MKGPGTSKVLLGVFLIITIALSSYIWVFNSQIGELQSQNNILQNQNTNLTNQTSTLQNQNSELQNQLSEIQKNVSDLQNQTNSLQNQNNILQNQNTELKNQIIRLQNQINESQNQASNDSTKNYEATIVNFSSSRPYSLVFGESVYYFNLTVQNTGNDNIENMILEGNLTLSDGESANYCITTPIRTLDARETQQISGVALFENVVVNLYGLHPTWLFVLKTPKVVLVEQIF